MSATAQQPVVIRSQRDLESLRACRDLELVTIHAQALKHRGLLPYALRYALWAVRPGGHIRIEDPGLKDPDSPIYEVPFNTVSQWTFRMLGNDVEVAAFKPGEIELIRRRPVAPEGWSAGVVFSGRDAELEGLRACLAALADQPELNGPGGEIVVCGPPGAAPDFLCDTPNTHYLDYVEPPGPRFLIGAKKNALAAALKGPRLIILHTRILLEPGALAATPREFDILAPNTFVEIQGHRVPYLSLSLVDSPWPGRMARRLPVHMRHIGGDASRLRGKGLAYVDGGAIITMRDLILACPISPHIGWEEGEDVEWCARALMHGYISDLAQGAQARSTTSKFQRPPRFGPLERPIEVTVRGLKTVKAAASGFLRDSLGGS